MSITSTEQGAVQEKVAFSAAEISGNYAARKRRNRIMEGVLFTAILLVLIPLALILFEVIRRGAGAMNIEFLTSVQNISLIREGGGYLNGLFGTLYMVSIASIISVVSSRWSRAAWSCTASVAPSGSAHNKRLTPAASADSADSSSCGGCMTGVCAEAKLTVAIQGLLVDWRLIQSIAASTGTLPR